MKRPLMTAVAATAALGLMGGCTSVEQPRPGTTTTPSVSVEDILNRIAAVKHLTHEQTKQIRAQYERNRTYWVRAGTPAVAEAMAHRTRLVTLSDQETFVCRFGANAQVLTSLSPSQYCPGGTSEGVGTVVITPNSLKFDPDIPFDLEAEFETGHELGHRIEITLGLPADTAEGEQRATCLAAVAIAAQETPQNIQQIKARIAKMPGDVQHGTAQQQLSAFVTGLTTGHC